jgi:hypothetical protein
LNGVTAVDLAALHLSRLGARRGTVVRPPPIAIGGGADGANDVAPGATAAALPSAASGGSGALTETAAGNSAAAATTIPGAMDHLLTDAERRETLLLPPTRGANALPAYHARTEAGAEAAAHWVKRIATDMEDERARLEMAVLSPRRGRVTTASGEATSVLSASKQHQQRIHVRTLVRETLVPAALDDYRDCDVLLEALQQTQPLVLHRILRQADRAAQVEQQRQRDRLRGRGGGEVRRTSGVTLDNNAAAGSAPSSPGAPAAVSSATSAPSNASAGGKPAAASAALAPPSSIFGLLRPSHDLSQKWREQAMSEERRVMDLAQQEARARATRAAPEDVRGNATAMATAIRAAAKVRLVGVGALAAAGGGADGGMNPHTGDNASSTEKVAGPPDALVAWGGD